MIHLENITKSFGNLQVLRGIDLEIEKGEIVSIVGPSGAGKTTLLQIMGTLDMPDDGSVVIDGTQVNRMMGEGTFRIPQPAYRLCVPVPPTSAGVYGFGECNDTGLYCRKRTAGSQGGGYGNS